MSQTTMPQTFFSIFTDPTHDDIITFLKNPANKIVVENTMDNLKYKSDEMLHPAEKYFMEQYEQQLIKQTNTGGRRLSKKRPTARRRRSSKARKARKSRSTRRR